MNEVNYFVQVDTVNKVFDLDVLDDDALAGELGVDYDEIDIAYAIQDYLENVDGVNVEYGEIPDDLECIFGTVKLG